MINHQQDIDKIYLYGKDPDKAKYQFLINKQEYTGLKYLNDSETFIEYLNDMNDIYIIYLNIEEYNTNKKCKTIIFDDMIPDRLSNKKLNPVVIELFIRGRKLKISLVYITQSYFAVPKKYRLNSAYYFIMKIPNKFLYISERIFLK